MGLITDLEARMPYILANTRLEQWTNDRIDAINENVKNAYPYLLFRAVSDNTNNTGMTRKNLPIKFDFFLADLYYQGDKETLGQKLDSVNELLFDIIDLIPDKENTPRTNSFEIGRSSEGSYFWDAHNDNVIIVKRTVTIHGQIEC